MGYLYLCFISLYPCAGWSIKQARAQASTDTNIWACNTRQAKHFIFVFRKSWNARGQRTHLYIPTYTTLCICISVCVCVCLFSERKFEAREWMMPLCAPACMLCWVLTSAESKRTVITGVCRVLLLFLCILRLPARCVPSTIKPARTKWNENCGRGEKERESTCHVQKRCEVVSSSCVFPAWGHSCLSTLNNFSNVYPPKDIYDFFHFGFIFWLSSSLHAKAFAHTVMHTIYSVCMGVAGRLLGTKK